MCDRERLDAESTDEAAVRFATRVRLQVALVPRHAEWLVRHLDNEKSKSHRVPSDDEVGFAGLRPFRLVLMANQAMVIWPSANPGPRPNV
jgi:hypothetical protein